MSTSGTPSGVYHAKAAVRLPDGGPEAEETEPSRNAPPSVGGSNGGREWIRGRAPGESRRGRSALAVRSTRLDGDGKAQTVLSGQETRFFARRRVDLDLRYRVCGY